MLWTLDNPVVTKELRGRMRGARTYWLLFGYLLLLSLILFFSYLGWWNSHTNAMEAGGATAGFTVGRTFFKILFYSQAVMIALITPALTAGAISVEREQRTFEMLRSTTLRPRDIVWGKLASSVSFVVLLLTSSLPLLSLCFLLGGVSPGEVFFAYLLLIGDAFLFGSIGLCWSSFAANTATATVLSYATLILFFVVTFPFALPTLDDSGFLPSYGLCALNPVGAVTGAVLPEHYYGWTLPAWLPALLLNGTLSALLVSACINRLEDFPARRAAVLRGVTLLFAGLLVFFGSGVIFGLARVAGPGIGMPTANAPWLMMTYLGCALLLLFVPVLVTGDLEGWGSAVRPTSGVWSPRRVFGDATLPSGLPLALLLALVVVGLMFAGTWLNSLGGTAAVISFVGPRFGGGATLPTSAGFTHGSDLLTQASVLLVLVVVGLAGLGFLLSVLLGNRWSALTLLYLAVVLGNAMPFFTYATVTGSGPEAIAASHNPAVNSLYLCPFIPLWQLTDTLDPQHPFGQSAVYHGMIGYGVWPLWVGTGLLYLLIGVASYGLGLAVLRRKKAPTPVSFLATPP